MCSYNGQHQHKDCKMAEQEVHMTKVSTGKVVSTMSGPSYGQTINQYTFVHGEGKHKKSDTCHMTESQANERKKQLGGK